MTDSEKTIIERLIKQDESGNSSYAEACRWEKIQVELENQVNESRATIGLPALTRLDFYRIAFPSRYEASSG